MSHYDIKFLAWLSTNWLLSHSGKRHKSDLASLFKKPAGEVYEESQHAPPKPKFRKDIFDCCGMDVNTAVAILRHGWKEGEPIYIHHQEAMRRALIKRVEVYRPYGSDTAVGVTYVADLAGMGEVRFEDGFEYATSRACAESGYVDRAGERADHTTHYPIERILRSCLAENKLATIVCEKNMLRAVRYSWDASQQRVVSHPIIIGCLVTEDGETWQVSQTWFSQDTYPDDESCRKAHEDELTPKLRIVE